ncbi:helix-turn-helix domain-containing protein [Brucella thiophenivorans]|nr:helix-turn-helix domain-containing protein [Brucella thiophenivorans]
MKISDIIHTRAEAVEALKVIAARHGRTLNLDNSGPALGRRRQEKNVEICDALIDLLSAFFGVSGAELRSPLRCRREVSQVRQLGMYLAHTSFGMVMREVAIGFSRDRTTVMYACHLVEDSRDDEDYDAVVSTLEKVVNQDFSAWRMAA